MSHGRRRGQAAIEYIVTYGWAFVVILVTIGALAYFGVISPGKWLPQRCDLGQQLECVDYQLVGTGSSDEVKLYVRNNYGRNITVTAGNISVSGQQGQGLLVSAPVTLSPGELKELAIGSVPDGLLTSGERQQVQVALSFRKTEPPGAPLHTLRGSLYAEVA